MLTDKEKAAKESARKKKARAKIYADPVLHTAFKIKEAARAKKSRAVKLPPSLQPRGRNKAYVRFRVKLEADPIRFADWAERQRASSARTLQKTKAQPIVGASWLSRKLLTDAKGRASKRGLAFDLCAEDIPIPEKCPILGLTLSCGVGKLQDTSPSLDRIIPALGYVKGNVAVISHKANRIKNNGDADDMIRVAIWLKHNTVVQHV